MTEEEFKMRMGDLAKNDPDVKLADVQNLKGLSSWERNQIALHIHARHERPRHFLKWSTIQKTMFVGNAPYVEHEWGSLLRDALSPHRWSYKLTDPLIGRPVLSDIEEVDYNPDMSGNFIHQAFALNEFEKKSQIPTEDFRTIFEFGGGYGALCYIIHKLGFMGHYHLHDLPEMQIIQQYYLENAIGGGINVEYNDKVPMVEIDLFIANASISEVDEELRDKIFAVIDARYYYIVHTDKFDGIINKNYFDKLRANTEGKIEWQSWRNPYKPVLTYLYGRKL